MSILDSKKQLHFYIVTEIHDEDMQGRLSVGQKTIDHWHGKNHTYVLVDIKRGTRPRPGWTVVHERKVTPEELTEMRSKRNDPS